MKYNQQTEALPRIMTRGIYCSIFSFGLINKTLSQENRLYMYVRSTFTNSH